MLHSSSGLGTTCWYENRPGAPAPWPRHGIAEDDFAFTFAGRGLGAADLDGDLDLDVLLAGDNSGFHGLRHALAWYESEAARAVQTVRLGQPANPAGLEPDPAGAPLVGGTWAPRVSAFQPAAVASFLAVDLRAPLNVPTAFGTLLCAPPPAGGLFLGTPGEPFAAAVPLDCGLVGVAACSQGASFAPGAGLQLTNALDLVLGTYR